MNASQQQQVALPKQGSSDRKQNQQRVANHQSQGQPSANAASRQEDKGKPLEEHMSCQWFYWQAYELCKKFNRNVLL